MIPPFEEAQIALILAMQMTIPGIAGAMDAVSFLVTAQFYLLFLPLVIWCYNRSFGIRLLLLLTFCIGVNSALKIFFHSPRPYWVSSDLQAHVPEESFGMPSTHAFSSLVFFGYIGAKLRTWWVWIICIVMIVMMGFARVYLAVHFPTDVLTGWTAGILCLLLFLRYENQAAGWLGKKTMGFQIAVAFAVSLVLFGLSSFATLSFGSWEVPGIWARTAFAATGNPISPLSTTNAFMIAGLFFGAGAGAILSNAYGTYRADGKLKQRATRYGMGVIVLILFWTLYEAITPSAGYGAMLLNYICPAIAGVWITLGAPALFVKCGLMATE